eukprot:TRINITY_DN9418_c0_g1_i2.p1 TRINITY_DN9418_c0_g1~~TRINITY_DN9418_c0_g1_i2.p1  ORF type:complete len:140 (+),score=11.56 TRINITY_DN9418_c0_g1_i2:415-834(+)
MTKQEGWSVSSLLLSINACRGNKMVCISMTFSLRTRHQPVGCTKHFGMALKPTIRNHLSQLGFVGSIIVLLDVIQGGAGVGMVNKSEVFWTTEIQAMRGSHRMPMHWTQNTPPRPLSGAAAGDASRRSSAHGKQKLVTQ